MNTDGGCKAPEPTCTKAGVGAAMAKNLSEDFTFARGRFEIGNYDEDDFHFSERAGCKLFANWKCLNGLDWNINICCKENKGKEVWNIKSFAFPIHLRRVVAL